MLALRMASRYSPSSPASIVIWVKNTMSLGSLASSSISANRSSRIAVSSSSFGQVVLLARQPQIGQRDRVEVVVGQRNEPEPQAPQVHDFVDHALVPPLPRLLPVGAPDAAKRAVLRAAADGLHRRPHILLRLHQVPARRQKIGPRDAAALINRLRMACQAVCHHLRPHQVAIALHHGMRQAVLQRFLGKQRRVNTAIHHPRAPLARHPAHLVSAQSVARVHADADDVAGLNALGDNLFQRFVDENRVSHRPGCRRRQNEQPTGGDDSRAKRIVAGIHQKNAHRVCLSSCCCRGLRERLAGCRNLPDSGSGTRRILGSRQSIPRS